MAGQSEGVRLLAAYVVMLGHAFGGQPHGEVRVGIVVDKPGVGTDFVATHGNHAHGLGSTRQDDFGSSTANALSGHGDGLQAGGAKAVDGHGRGGDGEAGAQSGDTGYVHSLLGFRHGTAQDYVLDFFWVELGDVGECALDRGRGEVVGTGGGQGSAAGFADRGSDGTDYDGLPHLGTFFFGSEYPLKPTAGLNGAHPTPGCYYSLVAQWFAGFQG